MFWRFHKTCARRSNSPLWRDNDIARRACSDKFFVFTIERQPVFIQNLYCPFYIFVFGTLKKAIKENFPLSLEHEQYPVKYIQGFFFFSSVLPFSPRWLYMDFLTVSVFNFFFIFAHQSISTRILITSLVAREVDASCTEMARTFG